MIEFRDFTGVELRQDDSVIFLECGRRSFTRGILTKVTKKQVQITYVDKRGVLGRTYRYSKDVVFHLRENDFQI